MACVIIQYLPFLFVLFCLEIEIEKANADNTFVVAFVPVAEARHQEDREDRLRRQINLLHQTLYALFYRIREGQAKKGT